MCRSHYAARNLMMILLALVSIVSVGVVCSSCSKDESAENAKDYLASTDSAVQGQDKRMEEINQRIQEFENEPVERAERQRVEAAQKAEADPRNIPFGDSRQFEFTIKHPYVATSKVMNSRYTSAELPTGNCLDGAGIKTWFGNISTDDASATITYSIRVEALGTGGYEAFRDSLKGCKLIIPMILISEDISTKQRGFSPMVHGFSFSENGVHVNEPVFIR